jgi:carbonic anhydrase
MSAWLSHAEATRCIARQKYRDMPDDSLLNVTIQENVLVQLENLRTHPSVAAAVAGGKLKLHGWVYKIETGQVFAYDPGEGQFLPVTNVLPPEIPSPPRLSGVPSI